MKKRKFISLVLAFIMIMSNFSAALAADLEKQNTVPTISSTNQDESVEVIVELAEKPLLEYSAARTMGGKDFLATSQAEEIKDKLLSKQESIQHQIIDTINNNAEFKYSYMNTINGFSATVQRKDIEKIKTLADVKNVYLSIIYDEPEPQMKSSTDLIHIPEVWGLSYKGEGTVIAVIDSGVFVDHELMVLSDPSKVKVNELEVKTSLNYLNAVKIINGLKAEDVYKNIKFPYCFDYADRDADANADGNDHGVHVSGTVAANNKNKLEMFNGVAPEAQILGMKVFKSSGGGASSTDILAAVEDAITLGADAMNLSLGSAAGFTTTDYIYDYSKTFKNARLAGITVVCSAGNDDRIGLENFWSKAVNGGLTMPLTDYTDNGLVGSPSTSYDATSIASIENSTTTNQYILHSSNAKIQYTDTSLSYVGESFADKLHGKTLEYVYCGKGNTEDFTNKNVEGKIALVDRGDISFFVKVNNAMAAGAAGTIVVNNEAGNNPANMNLDGALDVGISVGKQDGAILKDAADKTITIDKDFLTQFPNSISGMMSDFTSWGTTADLKIKPEITAPGGNIYSTLPNNQYGTKSGTSMSAPHVAGAAAVMKQYVNEKYPNLSPYLKTNLIEKMLMSTARIVYDENYMQYSPRRQGSGLMNVVNAVKTDVVLFNQDAGKSKVELGDKLNDIFTVEFDVENLSETSHSYMLRGSAFTDLNVRYNISGIGAVDFIKSGIRYIPAEMTYGENDLGMVVGATTNSAITTTGSAIVTVLPNSTARVAVDVSLDSEATSALSNIFENGFFVEGFIELMSMEVSAPDLSIPYMGFYGDWSSSKNIDGSYYYDENYGDFYYISSYAYDYIYNELGVPVKYSVLGGDNYNNFKYNYIAFSPNNDKIADAMGMRANLLRNLKELIISIKDADGNIVRDLASHTYVRKTFYYSNGGYLTTEDLDMWDGKDNNGNLASDGQYIYEIKSLIDYEDAAYQSWNIPVMLDTTVPKLDSSKITVEENVKYLNLEISDNHFVKSIILSDKDGNKVKELAHEAPTDNKSVFKTDITSLEGDIAKIDILDFAGNKTTADVDIKAPVIPPTVFPSQDYSTSDIKPPYETVTLDGNKALILTPNYITAEEKDGIVYVKADKSAAGLIGSADTNILYVDVKQEKSSKGTEVIIQKELTEALYKKNMKLYLSFGAVTIKLNIDKGGEMLISIMNAEDIHTAYGYKTTDMNYDLEIKIDGSIVTNDKNIIKVVISAEKLSEEDLERAGVYAVDENNDIEYVMTYLRGKNLEFYPPHFSKFSVMACFRTFEDIHNHWAKDCIESMASKNIVNGKESNLFKPDDIVTRAEFVAMVVRALAFNGEGKENFENIDSESWYANYLALAKDAGLIDGKVYNAEGIISRVEVAKIISIAHSILNNSSVKFNGKSPFIDIEGADKDLMYIGYAVENNLIDGYPDKSFRPEENTTRAEAVTVIYKLLNIK